MMNNSVFKYFYHVGRETAETWSYTGVVRDGTTTYIPPTPVYQIITPIQTTTNPAQCHFAAFATLI